MGVMISFACFFLSWFINLILKSATIASYNNYAGKNGLQSLTADNFFNFFETMKSIIELLTIDTSEVPRKIKILFYCFRVSFASIFVTLIVFYFEFKSMFRG